MAWNGALTIDLSAPGGNTHRGTDPFSRAPPQFYYLFGFLFVVFIILIITCAEITIVLCYFQLCSEDYNWWCASASATALVVLARNLDNLTTHCRRRHC